MSFLRQACILVTVMLVLLLTLQDYKVMLATFLGIVTSYMVAYAFIGD